jgi:ABC-type phosphate transport system substrate-binding protein
MMSRNLLLTTTVIAGVAAFGAANAVTIYGGGSSLATNEYVRTIDAIGATTGIYVTATPSGNAGATGQTGNVVYTADGSGAGQKAFLLQDESVHNTSLSGTVHFGASDAFLTQAQVDCWNAGFGSNTLTSGGCSNAGYTVASSFTGGKTLGGPIIQLPAFGTPVAIAYTANYTKAVTLSDSDLCGIFSGKITDWNQTTNVPGSTHPAAFNGAITVVVRSDGSGTSFLMTQHLSKVCTTGTAGNSNIAFSATKTFSTLFSGGTLPSNFVQASGSGGVANAAVALNNAIAYLTPDYTSVAPNSVPNSTAGSVINNWTANPASKYLNLKTAKVYNSHQGKAYAPNAGGTTLALKSPNLANGDTIAQVPSSQAASLNPLNWIPVVADPLQGYPIVGYTTLLFAQCYSNASIATEIKDWLTQLYGSANKTNLTKEGFVAAPAGFGADIVKAYTKNVFGFNIDINNSGVCNSSAASNTYAGL